MKKLIGKLSIDALAKLLKGESDVLIKGISTGGGWKTTKKNYNGKFDYYNQTQLLSNIEDGDIDEIVIRSSRVSSSTASPYISTEYPSNLFAPKIESIFIAMSLADIFAGRFPTKFILTDSGVLNQTLPLLKAAAMSLSPIP